jgi:hypothetical protein
MDGADPPARVRRWQGNSDHRLWELGGSVSGADDRLDLAVTQEFDRLTTGKRRIPPAEPNYLGERLLRLERVKDLG